MSYIIHALLLITAVGISYFTIQLFLNAKGSLLYNAVQRVGLFSVINILAINITLFYQHEYMEPLIRLLPLLISWSLYSLWKIQYKQNNKRGYTILFLCLTLLSITSELLPIMMSDYPNQIIIMLSAYQVFGLLMYLFIILKFFEYRKQNNTPELNFVPFLLLINMMSIMTSFVTYKNTSLIFSLFAALSMLAVMFIYMKDYKKSFYY